MMLSSQTIDPNITLHPFHPEDQSAVKELVLAGLVEHWGWLDPTRNPDLEDIATSYADAIFLVARRGGMVAGGNPSSSDLAGGEIVGCGALVPRTGETAEVVRMSVAADCRRMGIGRRILQALITRARQAGFQRVILETTESWEDVITFYLDLGFRITHHQDGDVYFLLEIYNF